MFHKEIEIIVKLYSIGGIKKNVYINLGLEMFCFLVMASWNFILFSAPVEQYGYTKILGIQL